MKAPISLSPVARSIPFDNASNSFTASEVQAAIEEARDTAISKVRFTITLTNNGSLSNNQRFGINELLPNAPVIVPVACTLREAAFSNNSAIADAQFVFVKRTTPNTSAGTVAGDTTVYTWNITNALTATVSGINAVLSAGNEILVRFVDTGNNPSDAYMILTFEVT